MNRLTFNWNSTVRGNLTTFLPHNLILNNKLHLCLSFKMFKTSAEAFLRNSALKIIPSRFLSTAAQPQPEDRLQSFRLQETDPTKHSSSHFAQFYRIPPNERKILFQNGGLPKSFDMQCKTFNETCIMVREPSIEVINYLKLINYSQPAVRFVLYGKKGSGKSVSLAHILHYAHKNNFLLVHVPWVGNWMRRCQEFSNSETKEGFVDLNLDAAAWLLHFKTQNAELLKNPELKVLQDIHWNKRETTTKDSSLIKLVDHGISRVRYASDCITVLAEQIKNLTQSGVCKTLVAIDGFNAFFYPNTRVYTEKKEMVPPNRVTISEGFLNLTRFDWKNSAIVVTVDEIAIAEKDQISYLPRYLLGKQGFEHMDPFIPIEVLEYSRKEMTSVMDYFRERKWVNPYPGQDDELYFLSGGNPFRLMNLCNPL